MARCPDCNRFVGNEEADPEVDVDVQDDGDTATVTGTVRIVNECSDCGSELTETTFDVEAEVEIEEMPEDEEDETGEVLATFEREVEVDEGSIERTSRSEGKGRGTRTYYGASGTFTVTVRTTRTDAKTEEATTTEKTYEVEWSDECQASSMDALY